MPGGRGNRKRKTVYRGQVVYMARAFYKGHKRERVTYSETACRQVERALYDALKAEVDAAERAPEDPTEPEGPRTLGDVLAERVLRLEGSVKTSPDSAVRARSFARVFATHYAALDQTPVAAVAEPHIAAYRDARIRAGRAAATVNRELRELRAAIKWARPTFKLSNDLFLPEDDLHVDSLTPDEAARMRVEGPRGRAGARGHAWNPEEGLYWPFSALEALYLLTGLRASEAARLRRPDVRLDLHEIRVTVKGGAIHHVALGAEALAIVRDALARQTTPFVFPNLATGRPYSRVSISRVHRRRAQAALGRRFRLHDTRHHAGTKGMEAGASTAEIQQFLRLKSPKMVQRYARLERGSQRRLADAIAGLTTGVPPAGSDTLRVGQTMPPAPAAPASPARGSSRPRRSASARAARS